MQKNSDSPWKSKMRIKFYEDLFGREGYYNSVLLTKEKYESIIKDIKRIKAFKKPESTRDYLLIERYDVLTIDGCEKLVNPKTESDKTPKIYVHSDELFDILYTIHTSIGHGGRDKMLKMLRAKYKNITRAQLKIFLDLCESCHPKKKKGCGADHVRKSNFNNRSQVTYIDFLSKPDEKFNFILVYKEESTQFVVLKPLVSMCAQEITYKLMDIFLMFGAPINLYLDNVNELCNDIMDIFRPMWPEMKMSQGKPKTMLTEDSNNKEGHLNIEKILTTWMTDNNTTKWSEGLRFVQFMKNRAYHIKVEKSPYEAVFGSRAKIGLALTSEKLIKFKNTEYQPETEIDINSPMFMIKMEPSVSMESLSSLAQDPLTEDDSLFDSYNRSLENVEAIIMEDTELPSDSKSSILQIEMDLLKRPLETTSSSTTSNDTGKKAKKS